MRDTIPLVMDRELPPVGKPYANTASLICGNLLARATAGCVSKNVGSSSCRTARSMPGATATTVAGTLSPAALACTCTWLAYSTTCAFVRIRLPSITTPDPLTSLGACLVQGLKGSGNRMVEKTLTTEFSMGDDVSAGWACAAAPRATETDAPYARHRPRRDSRLHRVIRRIRVPICRPLKRRAERCPAGRNVLLAFSVDGK